MNHLIRFLRHINRISHELETEPDWAELEQISNALVQRELHTAFGLLNSVAAESVYLSFAHRLLMVRYHTLIGNLESAQSLIHGYTSDVLRTLPLADAAWRHRTGLVERLAGNLHAAVSLCIEAEQLYTSVAMEYDAALVRADLGLALIMRGDTSAGIEALVAALPIIKEQGTEVQVNAMMANLASARFKSGDYRGAETDFREILGKPPFHTPSSETAALLQNLAIISKAQGRLQESLHLYRSALDCAQPGTNKLQYLRLLNGRADVEYRLENISGFLETAQQLQQLVSEVGIVPPPSPLNCRLCGSVNMPWKVVLTKPFSMLLMAGTLLVNIVCGKSWISY